jgi:hypothetical protein
MESSANRGPGPDHGSESLGADTEGASDEVQNREGPPARESDPETDAATAKRQFNRRLQTPTVLILDGSVRAELYEMWLGDRYSIRTATSRTAAIGEIDETVGAAVIRNEISDEVKSEIQDHLSAAAPSCKVVMTTSGHSDVVFPGMDYDDTLSEPITKDELRSTVGRLLARSRYDAALRQYYRCSVDAANLEVQHTAEELAANEQYGRLKERITMLTDLMETLLERFDEEDLESVLDGVRPKPTFVESEDAENAVEEKHRPPRCSNCGLEWGVFHGQSLREGYKRLGSFVWECARCGSVRSIPNPNNRRVARRR